MDGYGVVTVGKDVSGKTKVFFHYNPQLVAKVKTIDGREPLWTKFTVNFV